MSSGFTRRSFLLGGGAAMSLLAGCASLFENGDSVQDSDGDGMIDSEDYAPRDPNVQKKSDLDPSVTPSETTEVPTGSTNTTTPTHTATSVDTTAPPDTTDTSPCPSPAGAMESSEDAVAPAAVEPQETPTVGATSTPPPTLEEPLGGDPAPLLSLEGASASPGETTTLSGTLVNPYLFDVHDVSVALSEPEGWNVSAMGSTSFERIESQGSREVSWEVTVPDDASGSGDLTAIVTYETNTDSATVEVTTSVLAGGC